MSAEHIVDFERGVGKASPQKHTMAAFKPGRKKLLQRATVAPEDKLLVCRKEAAQLLSISVRGVDYLVANRHLPTRRIGGPILIPVADLRKYTRADHPERIVS